MIFHMRTFKHTHTCTHVHHFRPRNVAEKKANSCSVVACNSKIGEIVVKSDKTVSKTFTFDKVFDRSSTQIDVYGEVVSPIISEVLQGYNCTVFA